MVAVLNNLAVVLSEQGKAEEAEPLHRRALDLRQRCLGPNHPDVATLRSNLAASLSIQ
ncbi:unnamed protein product, partial [Discosporangium mesarthrocarpum]